MPQTEGLDFFIYAANDTSVKKENAADHGNKDEIPGTIKDLKAKKKAASKSKKNAMKAMETVANEIIAVQQKENMDAKVENVVEATIPNTEADVVAAGGLAFSKRVNPDERFALPSGETVNTLDYLNGIVPADFTTRTDEWWKLPEYKDKVTITFRSMVKFNGQYYPPMATKTKNASGKFELEDGNDLKSWEKSVESDMQAATLNGQVEWVKNKTKAAYKERVSNKDTGYYIVRSRKYVQSGNIVEDADGTLKVGSDAAHAAEMAVQKANYDADIKAQEREYESRIDGLTSEMNSLEKAAKADNSIMEKEFMRLAGVYERYAAKNGKDIQRLKILLDEKAAKMKQQAKDGAVWQAGFYRLLKEYVKAGQLTSINKNPSVVVQ